MPEEKKKPVKAKKPITGKALVVEVRRKFNKEVSNQVNEFNSSQMAAEIIKRLNHDRQAAIWRLLGLDDTYGRLEVRDSRRDGAAGPIVNMITAGVQEEVNAWLAENVRKIIEKHRERFHGEYLAMFEKAIKDRMSWDAECKAREAAREVLEQVSHKVSADFLEQVRNTTVDEDEDEEAQREGPAGETHPQEGEPGQA